MKIIKLKYTAQLKDKAGTGSDTIEVNDNDKLQDVLKQLAKKYGDDFGSVLFDENGEYRHSNLIVVNQNQVNYEENIAVTNGMQITLMSPISGG